LFSFIFISLSFSLMIFFLGLMVNNLVILIDWELFSFNSVVLVYRIVLDWVRVLFMSIVLLISGAVMFYREEYILHEKTKNSFCLIVFLFVVSIIFLIIRPNLIRVILGWDGLGLVSYLLVIYYQNYKSYAAGILTCLRNRIGDSAILIAIGWFLRSGRIEFIFCYNVTNKEIYAASAFIVLAAMTKRAQIPFSSWLPAAIAAPTPVSALVHSSTLVTAGVYLLIRFFPMFSSGCINEVLFIIGALTITISRLGAIYEIDLKKIIALSTLRQLGLIIMSLGIKLYLLAFFHLLTHALFKASLFLCAGRMIHFFRGSQDIRHLNRVSSYIPITTSCLNICSLSLGGFPFLAAFYSKDKIIEEALSRGFNVLCLRLLFVSVCFTIIYSFRLIYYVSIENYRIGYELYRDRRSITKRIFVLTLGGVIRGRFFWWVAFPRGYNNIFRLLKVSLLVFIILGGLLGLVTKFIRASFNSFYMRMI
jgi:NADH-ubiquinone oxidoreductase chain 5